MDEVVATLECDSQKLPEFKSTQEAEEFGKMATQGQLFALGLRRAVRIREHGLILEERKRISDTTRKRELLIRATKIATQAQLDREAIEASEGIAR